MDGWVDEWKGEVGTCVLDDHRDGDGGVYVEGRE
jgi:hypothetical protein